MAGDKRWRCRSHRGDGRLVAASRALAPLLRAAPESSITGSTACGRRGAQSVAEHLESWELSHCVVSEAPLVHVSLIPAGETRNLAREGKLGFLFPTLSPVTDNTGHSWFVDLRLIAPVSKAVLLGREPIEGKATEADCLSFGETLAQKFRRPALSENLSGKLPDALRRFIKDRGRNKRAFTKVEQVRLSVSERDRLLPARAQLIVIMDTELSSEEKELWQCLETETSTLMSAVGVSMMPMTFVLATDIRAILYRQSVPLWCDLLGFPRYP